ncbi:hypothetical protein DYB36_010814 [Aphanomyces astaci]|uniref:Uncharacterized protein n=1 Tax=Aphanomyces astaci TaxID=112090 RepID=A0A397FKK2_APHAT|nr:hypothetical protein DYB36_010814 [Aphanomyces astaci]RHZ35709.1 hypothetical protein DYB31_012189 [Aphanomyces astaci]
MATQERYYNGETRTCNLCDDSTVSYRPTKKLKHLMHHVAKKQFIGDIKFDENKKIIDPNSHFQFVEGQNFVVYRQKVDPDVITGATGTMLLARSSTQPAALHSGLADMGSSMRGPNLRDSERRALFERMLEISSRGVLPRGAIVNLAREIGRDRATITRVLKRGLETRKDGDGAANVASKIRGNKLMEV